MSLPLPAISMHFFDRLADRITAADSVVSVGLDPDPDRLPETVRDADLPRWQFNRRIIDATHEHAACYKPNAAFYEDADGWRALRETIAYAHGKDVPVLLDAKRGDIGNTARQYARALDHADAITVNPYMGRDSLEPFLSHAEKGVFVLCRTSNPGGADLQDLELATGEPVYRRVAALADLVRRKARFVPLLALAYLVVSGYATAQVYRDRRTPLALLVPVMLAAQYGYYGVGFLEGLTAPDPVPQELP